MKIRRYDGFLKNNVLFVLFYKKVQSNLETVLFDCYYIYFVRKCLQDQTKRVSVPMAAGK